MNHLHHRRLAHALVLAAGLCLLGPGTSFASPGAHGPNGEHLDGPAANLSGAGVPRLEAHSEQFELVARLQPQSFVIYLSRYETNEAVLGARLDVELGAVKAAAVYQAEAGTYEVSDKKMLAELDKPGTHALVFTVSAGTDSDLLDGALAVAPHSEEIHEPPATSHALRNGLYVAGGGGALLILFAALRRRSRRMNNSFGAA
ncbi:hypothetical protein [Roseateles microcysteis]|uniref:hypothetical protein n=1 Tax=Roseateles microcysteis TaxID=3119057 RepID=UPI002FE66F8F